MAVNSNNLILPAQVLALSSSAFLSGYIFSFSHVSIRSILAMPSSATTTTTTTPSAFSPTAKAQLWSRLYGVGLRTAPPLAAVSAGLFTYLAYRTSEVREMYGLAAALTIAIAPWTGICMRTVNGKLQAKAEKNGKGKDVGGEEEEEKVRELLKEWAVWNYCRAMLPLIGCVCGWWATVNGIR